MTDTQSAISCVPLESSATILSQPDVDVNTFPKVTAEASPDQETRSHYTRGSMNNVKLRPAPLLFQPDEHLRTLMPSLEREKIPQYLFRLYTEISDGVTNTETVLSHVMSAMTCSSSDSLDIFSLSLHVAASRLNDHLRWTRQHQHTCNLVSWTSSILVALVYGFFRNKDMRFGRPALSEIKLLILDTQDFPSGTFVKDMDLMTALAVYDGSLHDFRDLRRKGKYYFGEYLTQGELSIRGRCTETTMQLMVDLGLGQICPEPTNTEGKAKWANAILEIRETSAHNLTKVSPDTVQKAILIAQGSFGGRWTLPVAGMLLGIGGVNDGDSQVIAAGLEQLMSNGVDQNYLSSMRVDDWCLPELSAFNSIIDSLQELKNALSVRELEELLGDTHI